MYVFIFWRNEVKAANNIKVSEKKGIGSTLIEKKSQQLCFISITWWTLKICRRKLQIRYTVK